jgi:hypothetical protein
VKLEGKMLVQKFEVQSLFYIALDIGYISEVEFDQLIGQTREAGKILHGLRVSIDRRRKPK